MRATRPTKKAGRSKAKRPAKKRASPDKKERGAHPQRRKAALKLQPAKPSIAENPRAKELAYRIASLVSDKKATEVVVYDVRGMTSYADYFVIASGESDRQVAAMAEHVETTLKHEGVQKVGSEGYETGQWVLVDYGEVVAHLFFRDVRAFYDLDGLWADAPRENVA